MDEPLSSLDAKLRSELRLELKRIHRELGATIVYVTHDQIEALTMADRIGVLRAGRLVQVGAPREIYEAPLNVYVASRLGSPAMNLLPGDLLPVEGKPAGTATVGARTEHLRIGRVQGGSGMGTVQRIEHLGDQNHIHLAVGDHTLVTLGEPDVGAAHRRPDRHSARQPAVLRPRRGAPRGRTAVRRGRWAESPYRRMTALR